MPTITFVRKNGQQLRVVAPVGQSLMEAATGNLVPGILGDCGGCVSCGTCEAQIDRPWAERLEPQQADEIVRTALRSRRVLLVLDNLEHLPGASDPLGEPSDWYVLVELADGGEIALDDKGRTFFDHEARPAYMTGACVDMPSEPAGTTLQAKVKILAYPTVEKGGVVWTYMGPRETPPELPNLEANMLPEGQYNLDRMREDFTMIAEAAVFIALIWFAMRFVWPPLLHAIEARQKTIADGLAEAEAMLADPEMRDLAADEVARLREEMPALEQALTSVDVGQITGIVETAEGLHIVRVDDTTAATSCPRSSWGTANTTHSRTAGCSTRTPSTSAG